MTTTELNASTTAAPDTVRAGVEELATKARVASRRLALLPTAAKNDAIAAMADALVAATDEIVAANAVDLERGRDNGTSDAMLDRLRLDPARIEQIAAALREIVALPDPIGEVVRGSRRPNGLQLRQVRVPLGVVGVIYESRPNVTVDVAGLSVKSGNACLLRGGSAAADSNRVLARVLRDALAGRGISPDVVNLVEGGHAASDAMMAARGFIDVLIPRGGAGLIQRVVRNSRVPTIETGAGNCHVYVDAAANLAKAVPIVVNSKTHRPSVCNAAETLLVHRAVADAFLPMIAEAFAERGVTVHGDETALAAARDAGCAAVAATDEDWDEEYLSLDMAVRVVDTIDAAIEHVRAHSTGHTEAIVTEDLSAARRWTEEVDAAAVIVNASTRFTDGGEFGFGAEIGISTQKLHARGPMGLAELTTTKWIVEGDGQIR